MGGLAFGSGGAAEETGGQWQVKKPRNNGNKKAAETGKIETATTIEMKAERRFQEVAATNQQQRRNNDEEEQQTKKSPTRDRNDNYTGKKFISNFKNL